MTRSAADHAPLTLVLPSDLDAMAEARVWLDGPAREAGFDEATTAELALALTEALSNVIRHAYGGAGNGEITLTASLRHDALTLTVRDFGAWFDRSTHDPVDLDLAHAGGYGVYVIEAVMDEVHWATSSGNGNLLTMVKRRPGRDPGHRSNTSQ